MNNEDAATAICRILESVQDINRAKVLELVRQDYCFSCGGKINDREGCQCWNSK